MNRKLATKIFETLQKRGADLGDASIGIIEGALDANDWLNELLSFSSSFTKREEIDQCVTNPNWKHKSRVHSWRNYIPSDAKEKWEKLAYETKFVLVLRAVTAADAEEWD